MKILKTRKVKSPAIDAAGLGINFYLPYDLPGTDYLAPKQSAIVPLGFAYKLEAGTMLLPVPHVKEGKVPQPLQLAITVQKDEAFAYVTNLGDDLVELKPGKFIFRAVVVPIIDEKVQEVETLDEFLNGPKKDPLLDFEEPYTQTRNEIATLQLQRRMSPREYAKLSPKELEALITEPVEYCLLCGESTMGVNDLCKTCLEKETARWPRPYLPRRE